MLWGGDFAAQREEGLLTSVSHPTHGASIQAGCNHRKLRAHKGGRASNLTDASPPQGRGGMDSISPDALTLRPVVEQRWWQRVISGDAVGR